MPRRPHWPLREIATLFRRATAIGALAQLGERLLCKHQVIGSIPISSTTSKLRSSENGQRCIARPQGAALLRLTGTRARHAP